MKRLYGIFHDFLVRIVRRLPLTSNSFGPPKGSIADMKQWVETYCRKAEALSGQCWYSTVRAPSRNVVPKPRTLENHSEIFQQEQTFTERESFTACIPQARIIIQTGVVISPDDYLFEQSCSWERRFFPTDIEYNSLRPLLRPTRLAGTYLTISSRAWTNYYHWVSECLTRLCVAEGLPDVPLLFPKNLSSWHKESLALLGVKDDRIIELDDGCYGLDQLYFPSFPGVTGYISGWAIRRLREKFRGQQEYRGGLRLYVSRSGANHRRVINEDEVIRVLEKEGFVVVEGNRLSVAEQVQLFANAEAIVGAHGAGMTNVLFAPDHTQVIEILDPAHQVGCYYGLSASLRQRYWYLFGENLSLREGRVVKKGYDDISVPVEQLLRTLDAGVAEVAQSPSHSRSG